MTNCVTERLMRIALLIDCERTRKPLDEEGQRCIGRGECGS